MAQFVSRQSSISDLFRGRVGVLEICMEYSMARMGFYPTVRWPFSEPASGVHAGLCPKGEPDKTLCRFQMAANR